MTFPFNQSDLAKQYALREIRALKSKPGKRALTVLSLAPLAACNGNDAPPMNMPPPPPASGFTEDPAGTFTGTDQAETLDQAAATTDVIVDALGGDDTINTGSGADVIQAGSGADTVDAGAGDDMVRGGLGADTVQGGDGDDIFVIVGVTGANEFTAADITNPAGTGIDLSALLTLETLNDQGDSESADGESIDGGAGNNTLFVFGTADLTGVTLTNVQVLTVNSDVTLTLEQFESFITINGDGEAVLNIVVPDNPDGAVILDLTGVDISDIAELNLVGDITIVVNDLSDLDGIMTLAAPEGTILTFSITGSDTPIVVTLDEIANILPDMEVLTLGPNVTLDIDQPESIAFFGAFTINGTGTIDVGDDPDVAVALGNVDVGDQVTVTDSEGNEVVPGGVTVIVGAAAERLGDDTVGFLANLEDKTADFDTQLDDLDRAFTDLDFTGELISIGSTEIVILNRAVIDHILDPDTGEHIEVIQEFTITITGSFNSSPATLTELLDSLDDTFDGTVAGLTIETNGTTLLNGTFTDTELTLTVPGSNPGEELQLVATGDFPLSAVVLREILQGTNDNPDQEISLAAITVTANGEEIYGFSFDENSLVIVAGDFRLEANGEFLASKSQVLSMANLTDIVDGDLTGLQFVVNDVRATRTADADGNPLEGDAGLIADISIVGRDPVDLGDVVGVDEFGTWFVEITQSVLDSSLLAGHDTLDFSRVSDPVLINLDSDLDQDFLLPRDPVTGFPFEPDNLIVAADVGESNVALEFETGFDPDTGMSFVINEFVFSSPDPEALVFNIEVIKGGQGDDRIGGSVSDNIIFGDAGNDLIVGSYGDDVINGGAGDDVLWGDDVFFPGTVIFPIGGSPGTAGTPVRTFQLVDPLTGEVTTVNGDELAYGLNGADRFVFDVDWGNDVIFDFELERDVLDFSSLGITMDDLTITTFTLNDFQSDFVFLPEDNAVLGMLIEFGDDSIQVLGFQGDLTESNFDFGVVMG